VRREDEFHSEAADRVEYRVRLYTTRQQLRERSGVRTPLQTFTSRLTLSATPDSMMRFGHVRQAEKLSKRVGQRSDSSHILVSKTGSQFIARAGVSPSSGLGELSDLFDLGVDRLALVGANRISQHRPEQLNIGRKRDVFGHRNSNNRCLNE